MPISLQLQYRSKNLAKEIEKIINMDMKKVHKDLGQEMVNMIEGRFDIGIDPDGKKWVPLKREYKRALGTRKKDDIPLKFKELYKSFGFRATDDEVTVGTPKPYAKFHTDFPNNNLGSRKKIPLREFMGVTQDNDFEQLVEVIEDHFTKGLLF